MILFVSLAALAGQPGSGSAVIQAELGATVQTGRSGVIGPAGRANVASPEGFHANFTLEGLPGVERDLLDTVNQLTESLGNPAVDGFSGPRTGRTSLSIGWQHNQATREAGLRADVDVQGMCFWNGGANDWIVRSTGVDITGFDSAFLVGPEAFVGGAQPFGDEVGDPLLVSGVRASWVLPALAWSFRDSFGGDAQAFLDELGVANRTALISPRANVSLDTRLTVDRFSLHLEPGVEWLLNNAASSRSRVEGVQPQLRLGGGIGWVF